jgi:Spy/CpxP family protein refolding chaperone
MVRQTAWVLALVLTCATGLDAVRPGSGQARQDRTSPDKNGPDKSGADKNGAQGETANRERWKWWLYDRAELGIADQQSQQINEIFESTLPKLRAAREEMDRADAELTRVIKEHTADLATVSLLVDRVESARSHYTKVRVLMLYRMHLLLSPDQRAKLETVRARERERRERDRERRKP